MREQYNGFGPTLAREYLAERHGIRVSCETLRQMMMAAGLWKDRAARRPRPHQPRYRRDCRGELIQVDGSKHWWFEDRGPQCTLLVYIDDATSELMHGDGREREHLRLHAGHADVYRAPRKAGRLVLRQAQRVSQQHRFGER
ncbi:hypothetical protein SPKIRA_05300 [Sphingomonas paucimobilis]|nr:hypothetical protein SPKIRA_05300 [Sphingomonas paucimobilis]